MARTVGAKNRFKLSEIQRAVRAARKAGLTVSRIEVQEGKFVVVAGEPAEVNQKASREPSEADLDRELADWEAKRGDREISP